jgi:hypothetical protein
VPTATNVALGSGPPIYWYRWSPSQQVLWDSLLSNVEHSIITDPSGTTVVKGLSLGLRRADPLDRVLPTGIVPLRFALDVAAWTLQIAVVWYVIRRVNPGRWRLRHA